LQIVSEAIKNLSVNLNQQKRRASYGDYQLRFAVWLSSGRGRASALSRWLGVSRQQVSRWFVRPTRHWTKIPSWAAVNANVWFAVEQSKVTAPKVMQGDAVRGCHPPGGQVPKQGLLFREDVKA
jgi:hypothetical protein